jgi:predicted P-loop ATPase
MIAKKSADRPLSKGIETDFKRANILDFLDKLKPSTEGKYFCPACGGEGLSITKEGKDAGDTMCWSNDCSWESIMDNFVALDPSPKATTRPKTTTKFKSSGERDKAAISTEITIDSKITELVFAVENDSSTPARASVALAAWCKEHGHNGFTAGKLLSEKLRSLKQSTGYDDDEISPKLLRDFNKIDKSFGDRFRYNTLFKQIELDGEFFDPELSKIEFVVEHGLKLISGREDISDCVRKIARRSEYNPVREYLDLVSQTHGTSTDILKNLASRYLGTDHPIHQTALVKFLVSAVARIHKPGCQVDTALILQGPQGFLKSGFFLTLASPPWFDDSMGNASDKDERLKLHCSWILEWAELETIFRKKDMSQVKAFMTTKIDKLRPPYGRSIESLARSSVFCGTTNEPEFLADSTGNRRFWVIPVHSVIDVRLLEQERDRIWAAAVALYKAGYPWHLTPDEGTEMDKARKTFESSDVWEDEILDWISGKEKTSMSQILKTVLGIETNQQDRKVQLRVRTILTRANWYQEDNPSFLDGKRERVWRKK